MTGEDICRGKDPLFGSIDSELKRPEDEDGISPLTIGIFDAGERCPSSDFLCTFSSFLSHGNAFRPKNILRCDIVF